MVKKKLKAPAISDKQVDEICGRVAQGETRKAVCRELGVSYATFSLMVTADRPTGLASRYARAREAQAESWADQIIDISDQQEEATDGKVVRFDRDTITGKDGEEKCDHEWISRSRLRVDTRKWLMAKLHPRAYGEKLEIKGQMTQTHEVGKSIVDILRNPQA